MKKVVVIPAYNEEKHLKEVIQKTKNYLENIIVVDDGSQDKTSQIAKDEKAIVLRHIINLGKGVALKTGCDYAYQKGAQKIIVMDADAQHNPEKIPQFLESLDQHDVIFGYREHPEVMPFVLKFGNWFINKITSFLYGLNLKDTQCGYRAFSRDAYKKIRWDSSDYCMESEMITRVGKHKLSYWQIPIQTIYSDKYKGTTVADGVKIVSKMIGWRLFR